MTAATQTIERPSLTHTTEPGHVAHIVAPEDDKTAQAIVTEARVFGIPVEALCGVVMVPQRDASKYPTCPACLEIYRESTGDDGDDMSNS